MVDKGCKIRWKTITFMGRWHFGATGNNMDKNSKGSRTYEDSGRQLRPAVEGYVLEQDRTK